MVGLRNVKVNRLCVVVECDFSKHVSIILRLGEGFAKVLAVEDKHYKRQVYSFEQKSNKVRE